MVLGKPLSFLARETRAVAFSDACGGNLGQGGIIVTRTACMEVDDEVLMSMNKGPVELAGEIRLAAAVKWYEMGMTSQERAVQLSGMGRAAFIDALSRFRVSPFQETAEEILGALNERSA